MRHILFLFFALFTSSVVFATEGIEHGISQLPELAGELKERVEFYRSALKLTSVIYLCEDPYDLTLIALHLFGNKPYRIQPMGTTNPFSRSDDKGSFTADGKICVAWSDVGA
ncbi:MAG: hypothetical protein C5B49_16130 [Bdellovibrio sp.]|nr:MAG: hypothetical protein C5B49_16130 [Bdellovibrio sp.]